MVKRQQFVCLAITYDDHHHDEPADWPWDHVDTFDWTGIKVRRESSGPVTNPPKS